MVFCPFCGSSIDEESIYCLNCGKELPKKSKTIRGPTPPTYQPKPSHQVGYRPIYQPRPFHPGMKAPMGERFIALLVDGVITNFCCLYDPIKDGIREGVSVGKGIMNLRVIDFNTGMPATIGQSIVRNCLCGWLDGCCCYLAAFIDENGRRIGDQVAGTVVILDQ
ncbi:MAG: zinc-ribbon domain-containing protein [Candidatus Hodarchaeales archaeon]|jgi:hypothetical protein